MAFALKPWLGGLFLTAYAVYFWRELRPDESDEAEEALEPLILARKHSDPPLSLTALQTIVALPVISGGPGYSSANSMRWGRRSA